MPNNSNQVLSKFEYIYALGFCLICGIAYGLSIIFNWHIADRREEICAVVFMSAMFWMLIARKNKAAPVTKAQAKWLLPPILIVVIVVALLIGFQLSQAHVLEDLQTTYSSFSVQLGAQFKWVCSGILILLGVLLFLLKLKSPFFYAAIEIIFAVASCFVTAVKTRTLEITNATVYMTAGYLVVRGLDNLNKAVNAPES
jgi:hypothetical protein